MVYGRKITDVMVGSIVVVGMYPNVLPHRDRACDQLFDAPARRAGMTSSRLATTGFNGFISSGAQFLFLFEN
jgi:hypothetical protein